MKISKAEFARRRKNLMGMMDKHTIAIIPGAREVTRKPRYGVSLSPEQ